MTAEIELAKPKSRPNADEIKRATPKVRAGAGTRAAERTRTPPASRGPDCAKAGAQDALHLPTGLSLLQAHDLVTEGLPVATACELMASFQVIDRESVLKAMGISERTLQRAKTADKRLDANASDRTLRLAAVAGQAIGVLGSQDAAERWLASPAIGLDRRRPIDLLQSSEGTELVKTLLTRMDYGVYA